MTTAVELQPLTPRQREVWEWIRDYHARERLAPSLRDVQRAFQFASPNGAVCHVKAIAAKGWLVLRRNTARSILPSLEALSHES